MPIFMVLQPYASPIFHPGAMNDAASQLIALAYMRGGSVLGDLAYTYDSAGHRATVSGSLARTSLPQPIANAVYNADNQLTQWGTTAVMYDANGSVTNDGTHAYTWDARNHLIAVDNGGTASFGYDPFGHRISKTVYGLNTGYLYNGANVVQELSGSSPSANLLSGGIDEVFARTDSSGTLSFLGDGLGSTSALTDSTGAIQQSYTYDPYGSTSTTGNSSSNSYQYTGRETDATGLYHLRARYYNPNTGRFISEDPMGFAGSGPNLYAYVGDDPINAIDPFGLSGWLTIYSSGTFGQGYMGLGYHSWISYTPDGGYATTYGTYGNNPLGLPNGLEINLPYDVEHPFDASRTMHLNDAQEAALMNYINSVRNQGTNGWSLARPCSNFASTAWMTGTGEWLPDGSPTMPSSPAGLTQSINTANAATPSFGQLMSWMWSHMLFF